MSDDAEAEGRALLRAGAAAYQNGDAAGALRIFEDAAGTMSGRMRLAAMVNAASMADELGDHRRAVDWFGTALAEMPADAGAMRPSALVNMSQALQHLGDLDGAQAALMEARSLLTDDPEHGALRVACLLSCTAVAIHRQRWVDAIELATESLDAARRFAPTLAGHPLMNLAAAYFETGRTELAVDFAQQALDAFDTAQDHNGAAETRQNLALMYIRSGRPEEAEPLLAASQEYFERSGLGPRVGIGCKAQGFVAELRGATAEAYELYGRSLAQFTAAGAVLEAAEVRIRVATVAFSLGRAAEAQRLLEESFRVYADHGLGLHCAQVDFWHAQLLESALDDARPDPITLAQALRLAVPSALAIDAVRHAFPNGEQRHRWNRELAAPAMRSAFRLAYRQGDAPLVSDLIETQCAGATVKFGDPLPGDLATGSRRGEPSVAHLESHEGVERQRDGSVRDALRDDSADDHAEGHPRGVRGGRPPADSACEGADGRRGEAVGEPEASDLRTQGFSMHGETEHRRVVMSRWTLPVPPEPSGALAGALTLAAVLAEVAASEGVAISLPPRLRYEPGGRIVLGDYITEAERRYGLRVRDERVQPI